MTFALDPLLAGDIDLAVVLIVLLKTVVIFGLLLVSVILMVWFERRVIGVMQNRLGPNRAYFSSEEAGVLEKFRPFGVPSPALIDEIAVRWRA